MSRLKYSSYAQMAAITHPANNLAHQLVAGEVEGQDFLSRSAEAIALLKVTDKIPFFSQQIQSGLECVQGLFQIPA